MRPTISIVIPTYNGATYVAESIESALAQTRPADEIIISDDNSSDNTLEICRQYGSKVKIFKYDNGPSGFVNGWNHAISLASSDYVCILHQDDLLAPTFLEEIEKAIIANPDVQHLFTPCKFIDGDSHEIERPLAHCTGETKRYSGKEYAEAYVFTPGHIHRCPGVVTHRDIFSKCQYRAEAGHIADDDFFIRVGQYTDVVGVLKPLASYREHTSSETGKLDALKLASRLLRDYTFQLKHVSENSILTEKIHRRFKYLHSKFTRRTIIYALRGAQFNYVLKGLKGWLRII